MCNCYNYDRTVHISVDVDLRTLLDRKNLSSNSKGQVAAHRVTGLITRAVLRLECSLDCISGSVGHQQNIFIFSLSAFLLKL